MSVLQPILRRPESVTEQTYRVIREAIVSQSLKPGQRIVETTLAQQLGVSKTPVREALLRLESVGLIEFDQFNRGGRVILPSLESIQSAYEVRMALEVETARLVATRGKAEAIAQVRHYAEEGIARAHEGDTPGLREADRSFHFSLSEATENVALARLTCDAFELAWTLRLRDEPVTSRSLECATQHIRMVEMIEKRDPDAAGTIMREHISMVEGMVLAGYKRGTS